MFLDFEKPIEELYQQLDTLKQTASSNEEVEAIQEAVTALEKKIVAITLQNMILCFLRFGVCLSSNQMIVYRVFT